MLPSDTNLVTRTTAALALVLTLTACSASSDQDRDGSEKQASADAASSGATEPCPEKLPVDAALPEPADPDSSQVPVRMLPPLPPRDGVPDEAWVCWYGFASADAEDMRPFIKDWSLHAKTDVPDQRLGQVGELLKDFEEANDVPAGRDSGRRIEACFADAGTRWMLAYSTGGEVARVVVDDFGCRGVGVAGLSSTTTPPIDSPTYLEARPLVAPKGFLETLEGLSGGPSSR